MMGSKTVEIRHAGVHPLENDVLAVGDPISRRWIMKTLVVLWCITTAGQALPNCLKWWKKYPGTLSPGCGGHTSSSLYSGWECRRQGEQVGWKCHVRFARVAAHPSRARTIPGNIPRNIQSTACSRSSCP